MGREIKFRLWSRAGSKFLHLKDFNGWHDDFWSFVHDTMDWPEHIHQFTGLLDQNGKEIYEGDILSFDVHDPHGDELDHITNAEVWWDGEYLCWNFGRFENKAYSPPFQYSYDMTSAIKKDSIVVTGNIFENPELLS